MKEDRYQPRTYRHWVEGKDLVSFTVTVQETDLAVRARENLSRRTHRLIIKYREQLEGYIRSNPRFASSLEPLSVPPHAPRIVLDMIDAGRKAGVGPMAAVAGAMAEYVGRELLEYTPEVIIENGGDIFIKTLKERVIGIYAGDSPLSGKLGMVLESSSTPLGICTSSGTVGHSLSFGKADAVVVCSASTALADAAATAICNRVKTAEDINDAIMFGQDIEGVTGIIVITGQQTGVWGDIKLCEI